MYFMQMHIGINNICDRDTVVCLFPGLKKTRFVLGDHRSIELADL